MTSNQPVPPVNHALHIVLSILTAGLWLFVYAVVLIMHGRKVKQSLQGKG